jgi:hypothetical protein
MAPALRADAGASSKIAPGDLSNRLLLGGEGGIRTHEPREGPPVFKTGAINRSATSPRHRSITYGDNLPRIIMARESRLQREYYQIQDPEPRVFG